MISGNIAPYIQCEIWRVDVSCSYVSTVAPWAIYLMKVDLLRLREWRVERYARFQMTNTRNVAPY